MDVKVVMVFVVGCNGCKGSDGICNGCKGSGDSFLVCMLILLVALLCGLLKCVKANLSHAIPLLTQERGQMVH